MAIARISHLSLRAPVGGVRREMAVKIGAGGGRCRYQVLASKHLVTGKIEGRILYFEA